METRETMCLFVRIAQSDSLSATGRAFGFSPACVSHWVNSLEGQFGTGLINRNGRPHAGFTRCKASGRYPPFPSPARCPILPVPRRDQHAQIMWEGNRKR